MLDPTYLLSAVQKSSSAQSYAARQRPFTQDLVKSQLSMLTVYHHGQIQSSAPRK